MDKPMDKDSFQRMEELLRNAAYFKAIFDEEDLLEATDPKQNPLRKFVETVYRALDKLSKDEKSLISHRYLTIEAAYIKNHEVFEKMGIRKDKYALTRRSAFNKLAELLQNDG